MLEILDSAVYESILPNTSDHSILTAELSAQVTKGLAARKQLLPIVRNKFAGNAGVLAEWATATRIVRRTGRRRSRRCHDVPSDDRTTPKRVAYHFPGVGLAAKPGLKSASPSG